MKTDVVTIKNTGSSDVKMKGWKLISITGNLFEQTILLSYCGIPFILFYYSELYFKNAFIKGNVVYRRMFTTYSNIISPNVLYGIFL